MPRWAHWVTAEGVTAEGLTAEGLTRVGSMQAVPERTLDHPFFARIWTVMSAHETPMLRRLIQTFLEFFGVYSLVINPIRSRCSDWRDRFDQQTFGPGITLLWISALCTVPLAAIFGDSVR